MIGHPRSSFWSSVCAWMALGSLLAVAATAQHSSLRAWGDIAFDTRGGEGFAVDINASMYMSAILTLEGGIYAIGNVYNTFNQVPGLPPGRRYIGMSVNNGGGAGLMDDGNVVVWGTWTVSSANPPYHSPAPALPPGMRYVAVSSGGGLVYGYCVAIRSDGAVIAWGDNLAGQCDIPTFPQGVSAVKVKAYSATTYIILSDGNLLVFGNNSRGQNQVPPLPPGVGYVDICPCPGFQLALRSDGNVVAWGDNTSGQCNVPPLPAGTVYTAIAGGSVVGGNGHSHAVRSDNVIVSWGFPIGTPPTIDPANPCMQLAAGNLHVLARFANGRVSGWGRIGFYQANIPSLVDLRGNSPQELWFRDVAQGRAHTLAVLSSGRVIGFGEPGNSRTVPPTWFDQYTFTKAKAGGWHSAALTTGGELFCWGDDSWGQSSPPPLPAGVYYIDMDLSVSHSLAVRSDGQAVAFGSNTFGQCNVPPLPAGITYTACSAAYGVSTLLRSDGSAVSFGSGIYNFNVATPPPGLRFVKIAQGEFTGAGLLSDGTVESGAAIPGYRPVPQLPRGIYYVEVAAGDSHLVLRRSDGRIEIAGRPLPWFDWDPPMEPGTCYVQVAADHLCVTTRVGPTSTYIGVAQGCSGTQPATRLVPTDTPRIGKTLEVRLLDLPQHCAAVALGWHNILPQPLSVHGLPGCNWDISLDAAVFVMGQNHEAIYRLPIPDWPGLIGLNFYNQAVVVDPGANVAGAVVSDAAQGVIGNW